LAGTKPHKYAQASCTILTRLGREELTALCDDAAVQAQSVQLKLLRTDHYLAPVAYCVRTRIGGIGKGGEKMTIRVDFADLNGQTRVKVSIAKYTLKRSWPFPWEMIGWSNYKEFMETLVVLVKARDDESKATIVTIAAPVTSRGMH